MTTTTTTARRARWLPAIAVTPLLRWLVAHHSVEGGQPWRTRCDCGQRLWPAACGPSGRCPTCSRRIGPPPYAFEAVMATAITLVIIAPMSGWERTAYLWWTAGAAVLAFTDLAVLRLPHRITAATTAGFLGLLAATGDEDSLVRAVLAGALLTLLLGVPAITSDGMGWGDVTLAFLVGSSLGWHSWTTFWAGTLVGLGTATGTAIALRLTGRLVSGSHLPLGPFLLAAGLTGPSLT